MILGADVFGLETTGYHTSVIAPPSECCQSAPGPADKEVVVLTHGNVSGRGSVRAVPILLATSYELANTTTASDSSGWNIRAIHRRQLRVNRQRTLILTLAMLRSPRALFHLPPCHSRPARSSPVWGHSPFPRHSPSRHWQIFIMRTDMVTVTMPITITASVIHLLKPLTLRPHQVYSLPTPPVLCCPTGVFD